MLKSYYTPKQSYYTQNYNYNNYYTKTKLLYS